MKSLKMNAILNMIRSILNLVFPLITFPYASRILLPSGIGSVNFANSIIEYFLIIASLGISSYASREAARIRNDKNQLNKFCKEIFIINLISTVIAYLLLAISLFCVPKFQSYRLLLIVSSTKILFSTIGLEWLYTAEEEYEYITIRSFIFQILSIIFLFVFVKDQDDYILYAGMGVFSSVGSNILNLINSRKYIDLFKRTTLEFKKHLKPIFVLFGNKCASKINSALDAVMLGFLLTDIAVGFYTVATKITKMVMSIIDSMVGTLLPRASYYLENNKVEEYNTMLKKGIGANLFFSLAITTGLFILSKPIIILFSGSNYLPALTATRIITFIVFPFSFSYLINNAILIPVRKEKFTLYSQIIGAILNIILNFTLIPKLGVEGAAIATVIVETAIFISRLIFTWKLLPKKYILKCLLQSIIGCIFMAIIIIFLQQKIENEIQQIIICIPVGIFVYTLSMLLLKNDFALNILSTVKSRLRRTK